MPSTQFKDLGKKAKDLFKKQYDYKNELKVTSTSSGVKLETTGSKGKDSLCGSTKANFKDDYLGDVEIEVHSSGTAKGQFKLSKIADGADLTVTGAESGEVTAEVVYSQGSIAALLKAVYNDKGPSVSAAATVGFDGVTVGGQVDVDAAGAPKDYNLGAEYATKDLTAALVTSGMGNDITVSLFQKLAGGTLLGASLLVKPEKGERTFTFGTDYSLDKATQIKAKADSNGAVGTAVVHTLKDPSMKVAVSAEFNALSDDAFKANKFGISLSFGEF